MVDWLAVRAGGYAGRYVGEFLHDHTQAGQIVDNLKDRMHGDSAEATSVDNQPTDESMIIITKIILAILAAEMIIQYPTILEAVTTLRKLRQKILVLTTINIRGVG